FFFFFQAEDGIRDRNVTGVQTCALPILTEPVPERPGFEHGYGISGAPPETSWSDAVARLESARNYWVATTRPDCRPHTMPVWGRSEERREGKRGERGGRRSAKRKVDGKQ